MRTIGWVLAATAFATMCTGPVRAQAAADDAPLTRGLVTVNASTSDGTQRANAVNGLLAASYESGRGAASVDRILKVRGDFRYGDATKPGQATFTTSEMLYGEMQYDVKVAPGTWLYGIASGYHHITFGLKLEQAYGAGAAYDVPAVSGLEVGADIRHITERFDGDVEYSSVAARVNETYSHAWKIGSGTDARAYLFTEAVEVVPAFQSSDTTSASEALQARAMVTLQLPLTASLSVPVGFAMDYLRNVPAVNKARYWQSTVGVSFTFGPK